ncbi:MAG: ComF family protein [Tolypothrix brevis GSE-NOS-MK-07-07A]|jgi:ComF family protein|nr:ComF family protein [Tolypothrix brevis GSE-NOS-MK-07-07A]
MSNFIKDLLSLFLQSNCPLCQRQTSEEFCQYCLKQLHSCHLANPNSRWQESIPVFAWGKYGGSLKRAIAVMKYENHPQIARPLGQWLGEAWLNSFSTDRRLIVVPIPLHPSKQKKRGYNQAALIAESFCQTTGLKLKQNGLARVQETEAQFGLSPLEREKNLAKAFALGKDFSQFRPNVPVLLIDDICTSGATAKSAVEVLHQCGIAVEGIAAIATPVKER